jgi:general secretion pathway protein D
VLNMSARILLGVIAVTLGLTPAVWSADPVSNDLPWAFDRSLGANSSGRLDERRSIGDDLTPRSRQSAENDYDDRAPVRSAALPRVRSEEELGGPTTARLADRNSKNVDPKTSAKACIARARSELTRGSLPQASFWYRESLKYRAEFGPKEDSPDRLATDIRRMGGNPEGQAGPERRGSGTLARLPSVDGEPADDVRPRGPSRRNAGPVANEHLLAARRALADGDLNSVRNALQRAKAMDLDYGPNDDTPERVESAMAAYRELKASEADSGRSVGWRFRQAKLLMEQAEALMRWQDYDTAEKLANTAAQLGVKFNPYESRPQALLTQIAGLRRQSRGGQRSDDGVRLAGGEDVIPAGGGTSDRRATRAGYDSLDDRTRNIRTGNVDSEAARLFQGGEASPVAQDRPAAARRNELDPQPDQPPQPAGPPRPGAAPPLDGGSARQLAASQLNVEIATMEKDSERMRPTDPRGALALLEQARAKVQSSSLEPQTRGRMLNRLDRDITDTRKFMSENAPRIAMEEQSQRTQGDIDRDRQAKTDKQLKIAQLNQQFNKLIEERSYAEAEVVAKQVQELDPDSSLSFQLVFMAKQFRHLANTRGVMDQKENGFIRSLQEVDKAAVPFDDSRSPMVYPDAKSWRELTDRRGRYGKDRSKKFTEREREIFQKLEMPVSVRFENEPLGRVVESLGQLADVNIVLDPQGMIDEGLSSDIPVSIDLRGAVTLKSALSLILKPHRLNYMVKDEVLKITSDQVRNSQTYNFVYNVADLVIPIPNFVHSNNMGLVGAYGTAMSQVNFGQTGGPFGNGLSTPTALVASKDGRAANPLLDPAVLAQMTPPGRGGVPTNVPVASGPGGMGGNSLADFTSLIDLIEGTIQPTSWSDNGGPPGATIKESANNLSLVISQTQEVHDEISDLLEQLRRLQDLQVTIEVRFITLNDNFFERIGVDFDFKINDNIPNSGTGWGRIIDAGGVTGTGTTATITPPTRAVTDATFREFGRENSLVVGRATSDTFTADLDIPFSQGSFGVAVPQFGGFDATAGANMGFAILSQIEAYFFINAVQGDRRSNVLQAPRVTLFNGQQASIADQSQTPFVMSVVPVVGDFAVGQQPVIVILSEGTFLSVQAVVSSDRRFVRLTVVPYFSQISKIDTFTFAGTDTTLIDDSTAGNQDHPNDSTKQATKTQTTREGTTVQLPTLAFVTVSTTVSVPDGGTILLGGIKRLSEGRNEAGVPILNKIPYLNRLFKNVGIGRETQSLMMMVTPRIIIQEEEDPTLNASSPAGG